MYNLTEFNALVAACLNFGWNFEVHNLFDGRQIILKNNNSDILNDTVIHRQSYGYSEGLLETWDETKNCIGYLTANEVLAIWEKNITTNQNYRDL